MSKLKFKLAAFADEAASSIDEQIKAMKENEISMLEIRGVDGQNIADISAQKAKETRKKLEDAGLAVWSLSSPFGKIGINDDFSAHLDKFKKNLETAQILGAKHIRLFSFYGANGEAEKYKAKVFSQLQAFVDAAKGSGIVLCHENEKGIYGDVASRCLEIHQAVPELKAIFDPANFIQSGQDTGEVLTIEPHLAVFEGFDKLEDKQKSQMNKYTYPSSRAAFDAAVEALKELKEVNYEAN